MADLQIRAILKDEFSAAAQKIIQELGQIGAHGSAAGAAMRSGMSSALPTAEAVTESLGRQNAQLRAQIAAYKSPEGAQYLSQQRRLREEVDALTQSGEKQSMTWANIASKYYLVAQAASFAAGVTGSLVEAASKYEMIRARLNAVERSESLGGKDLETIQELAKKPGLGFEQAASTFATLRGMKVTATEATKLINGIAAANASAAGTAEQFGSVMYQIQQSVSLGRLMAEDLRPIMQQIPTLGAAIQESFGSSSAEQLNKRLKESGMNVRDFWLKVAELGQNLPATGETISNNLDNMSDAWTRFKAALTNTDAIKSATGFLATFIEKLAEGKELAAKRKELAKEMRGREGNTWSDVLFGETENEFVRRYMQEGGRAKNAALIGQTSQSEAGASYAAHMTAPKTIAEKTAAQIEEEEKAAKKYAEAVKKNAEMIEDVRIDAFNKAEQDRANRDQILRMKLGSSDGLIKSESYMREDKKKDDEYWKARDKENQDLIRESKDIEKQITDFDRKEAERRSKIWEDEWQRRSDLARNYADTLSSTMASAYTDIWVNGRDVFASLYDAFSEMITKMAIEMAAKATIFGALSLIPGMGGASGLLGGAGSFIFGARATGGVTLPGVRYRVNEDGYNGGGGEMFRSSSAGTISPNRGGGGGGGGNVQHFHFAAGTSRADRGAIVRAIKTATKSRENSVARGI